MSEILKTEDLTRTFGSLVAVNHVNFSVEEGEIRSVIGRTARANRRLWI